MSRLRTLMLIVLLALVACGGGGGAVALGPGGGVGSGGTGAVAVVASGPIEGFGSIIVNGTRYETEGTELRIEDATELKLGMLVQISGTASADFRTGTAQRVVSAAQLRGVAQAVDAAAGRFTVLATTVRVDGRTVFGAGVDWAGLAHDKAVQVWGQPGAHGELLATRIDRLDTAASSPLLSGSVRALDRAARTFVLGELLVDFSQAQLQDGLSPGALSNGQAVRVRANTAPAGGRLLAAEVAPALVAVPTATAERVSISGPLTDIDAAGRLRVDGYWVDASAAQVSGGPASALQVGRRVEVSGAASGDELRAERIRLRRSSGDDGDGNGDDDDDDDNGGGGDDDRDEDDAGFSLSGPVGAFRSATEFSVRGQAIDASRAKLVFDPGVGGALGPGRRVVVTGDQVEEDVLQARQVRVTQ